MTMQYARARQGFSTVFAAYHHTHQGPPGRQLLWGMSIPASAYYVAPVGIHFQMTVPTLGYSARRASWAAWLLTSTGQLFHIFHVLIIRCLGDGWAFRCFLFLSLSFRAFLHLKFCATGAAFFVSSFFFLALGVRWACFFCFFPLSSSGWAVGELFVFPFFLFRVRLQLFPLGNSAQPWPFWLKAHGGRYPTTKLFFEASM